MFLNVYIHRIKTNPFKSSGASSKNWNLNIEFERRILEKKKTEYEENLKTMEKMQLLL
jgi:hypothetical protein